MVLSVVAMQIPEHREVCFPIPHEISYPQKTYGGRNDNLGRRQKLQADERNLPSSRIRPSLPGTAVKTLIRQIPWFDQK